MRLSELEWLERFFWDCCKGGWGNNRGIKISTLSNPGWTIEIIIEDTNLEDESFDRINIEREENDWLTCWVENKVFYGFCGPLNLGELIKVFRAWVTECDRILNKTNLN